MRIGRYQVVRLLSEGGMAEVYLARLRGEAGFEKQVVIKRAKSHLAKQESLRRQFIREATLSAQLSHPNIVQVFDFGFDRGKPYLVMEWVDGASLQDLTKRGASFPIEVVGSILHQALLGLEEASRHRILHRDLSPSNLLSDRHGQVKIADFGLAKLEYDPPSRELWGKLSYLSPEVKLGEAPDLRSDLYSLGVVGKELLGERQHPLTEIVNSLLLPRPERPGSTSILISSIAQYVTGGREALGALVGGVRQIEEPLEFDVQEKKPVLNFDGRTGKIASRGIWKLSFLGLATFLWFLMIPPTLISPPNAAMTDPLPAKLSVNALPWAHVFIDGEYLGETPLVSKEIPAGDHALTLINPIANRHSKLFVRLKPGKEETLLHTFSKNPQVIETALLQKIPIRHQ